MTSKTKNQLLTDQKIYIKKWKTLGILKKPKPNTSVTFLTAFEIFSMYTFVLNMSISIASGLSLLTFHVALKVLRNAIKKYLCPQLKAS